MKTSQLFFGLAVTLIACDFPNSTSEEINADLNANDAVIWEQVGVRDVATGDIAGVLPGDIVTLQIAGDDLLFGLNGNYCEGKIKDGSINFSDDCYTQSPRWIVSERTEDTMYIYPRLGAMYHHDLIMKKVQDKCTTECSLIPAIGSCKALIPKYYFDKENGKCKEFIWGGCQGVVPFETLEACEACRCY